MLRESFALLLIAQLASSAHGGALRASQEKAFALEVMSSLAPGIVDSDDTAVADLALRNSEAKPKMKLKMKGIGDFGEDIKNHWLMKPWVFALVSLGVWGMLSFFVALYYQMIKLPIEQYEGETDLDFTEWQTGLFDCKEDIPNAAWSCFCPCIRWADNLNMLALMNFWKALAIFVVLTVPLPPVLFEFASVEMLAMSRTLLFVSVLVYYRQEIRGSFGMNKWEAKTLLVDCLSYGFCTTCAIAQDARQIEIGAKEGHEGVVLEYESDVSSMQLNDSARSLSSTK